MDKLEYIRFLTGDIVYIHGSVRVISSCDGYYATYYDEDEILQEVNVNVIEGIPLTPEILEKNGWKPTKESFGHSFKNKTYSRFALWSINDKWNFTIDGVMVCNTLSCLCYVHQLQHLLFGLGLNHEMEV